MVGIMTASKYIYKGPFNSGKKICKCSKQTGRCVLNSRHGDIVSKVLMSKDLVSSDYHYRVPDGLSPLSPLR